MAAWTSTRGGDGRMTTLRCTILGPSCALGQTPSAGGRRSCRSDCGRRDRSRSTERDWRSTSICRRASSSRPLRRVGPRWAWRTVAEDMPLPGLRRRRLRGGKRQLRLTPVAAVSRAAQDVKAAITFPSTRPSGRDTTPSGWRPPASAGGQWRRSSV